MNAIEKLRPMLITTDQLLSRGMTSQKVSQSVASGELIRIRPGFYVEGRARELRRKDRHLLSVLAANSALDGPIFSHSSAALVHGLPGWGLPLKKVSVSEDCARARSRTSRLVDFHCVPNLSDDVSTVNGLRVTNAERTVTEVAMTAGRDASVAVADAALNSGTTTPKSLELAMRRAAGRPGIKRARLAMSLVDGKSESVAESLSRLTFRDFGLPEPKSQVEIFTPSGARVARVDFLWHEYGVVGECDGFGKYFDCASPAESRYRLGMEKDRDAELTALGYRVLHWRWRDLEEPHLLAARIRRVLFSAAA